MSSHKVLENQNFYLSINSALCFTCFVVHRLLLTDKSRLNKSLHTCNTEGKQILKIPTSDESAQAHFVAREILANINGSNGLLTYKDFAVLMRMNVTSQKFEEIFRFYKIPCTIVSLHTCE